MEKVTYNRNIRNEKVEHEEMAQLEDHVSGDDKYLFTKLMKAVLKKHLKHHDRNIYWLRT